MTDRDKRLRRDAQRRVIEDFSNHVAANAQTWDGSLTARYFEESPHNVPHFSTAAVLELLCAEIARLEARIEAIENADPCGEELGQYVCAKPAGHSGPHADARRWRTWQECSTPREKCERCGCIHEPGQNTLCDAAPVCAVCGQGAVGLVLEADGETVCQRCVGYRVAWHKAIDEARPAGDSPINLNPDDNEGAP